MKILPIIALMLLLSSQAFAFVYIAEGGDGGVTINANGLESTLWSDTSETIFAKADLVTPLINYRVLRNDANLMCIEYTHDGIREEECGTTVVDPNDWVHYGVVFDTNNSRIYMYLNGSFEFNNSLLGVPDTTSSPTMMARNSDSKIQYYGTVDRARIYGETLNQTQIQADMANFYQQDPAQYSWDFDLPSLTTAYDNHLAKWNPNWGTVMFNGDYDDSVQCIKYDAPRDQYFDSPITRMILDNLILLAALGILIFIAVVMVLRS